MNGLDKIELLDENDELILITNDDGFKAKGIKILKMLLKTCLIMFGNFSSFK